VGEEEEKGDNEDENDAENENEDEVIANDDNSETEEKSDVSLPPSSGTYSLDAQARFAAHLLLMNGPELGHIVTTLERECPAALEAVGEMMVTIPDQMEIILDNVDAHTFAKLSQYAAEKAASHKRDATNDIMAIDDISGKKKKRK
jgi:hypothetical protein